MGYQLQNRRVQRFEIRGTSVPRVLREFPYNALYACFVYGRHVKEDA